eukprot:Awhi_evm1s6324
MVSKNPCYLPGDIRVLRAMDFADFRNPNDQKKLMKLETNLIDCIVFSTKGKMPDCTKIAGSDLDGDEYLVCFDPELVPDDDFEPYHYNADPLSLNSFPSSKLDEKAMIHYFSQQNKIQQVVGTIDSLFTKWADKNGIRSMECVRLGKIFSKAIDAAKTGDIVIIPEHLKVKDDKNDFSRSRDILLLPCFIP